MCGSQENRSRAVRGLPPTSFVPSYTAPPLTDFERSYLETLFLSYGWPEGLIRLRALPGQSSQSSQSKPAYSSIHRRFCALTLPAFYFILFLLLFIFCVSRHLCPPGQAVC